MLREPIFGVQPSCGEFRTLRERRFLERDQDLHRFFDLLHEEEASLRREMEILEAELYDWDIEPLLRLPLQRGRRVGSRSLVSPIQP